MADTTTINAIPMPQLGDTANIENLRASFTALDLLLPSRFSSLSARNTAIPTPVTGQECFVTATGEKYLWDGTAWVGVKPRVFRKLASETRTNDTYDIDDHFVAPLEILSAYAFEMVCIMSVTSNAPDMKITWLGPTGSLMVYGGVGLTPTSTNPADSSSNIAGGYGFGTEITYGIVTSYNNIVRQVGTFITGPTSGNVQMYWAHGVNSPGQTLTMGGGYLSLLKIA